MSFDEPVSTARIRTAAHALDAIGGEPVRARAFYSYMDSNPDYAGLRAYAPGSEVG